MTDSRVSNKTAMWTTQPRIAVTTDKARKREAAFTLVELLVVLVILGLLAGIVGPQVMKYVGSSKTETARLQIKDLTASLDLYRLEVGRYPTAEQGLNALVAQPAGVAKWNGPYLQKSTLPLDPWGFAYHYRMPGEHGQYDLYSLGADDAEGGEKENQDIRGWE